MKFTGKIPVDEDCIEAIGNDYHVYIENNVAFDCMLNQVKKKRRKIISIKYQNIIFLQDKLTI